MLPDINNLMEQYDNNANAGRVAESDLTAEPMTSKQPSQTSIKESASLVRCCFLHAVQKGSILIFKNGHF